MPRSDSGHGYRLLGVKDYGMLGCWDEDIRNAGMLGLKDIWYKKMLKSWSAVQGLLIHLGFPLRGLAISARGKEKDCLARGTRRTQRGSLFQADQSCQVQGTGECSDVPIDEKLCMI